LRLDRGSNTAKEHSNISPWIRRLLNNIDAGANCRYSRTDAAGIRSAHVGANCPYNSTYGAYNIPYGIFGAYSSSYGTCGAYNSAYCA